MKKKSPPYAIIGAVLLGIVCIVLFYKMKQNEAAAHQADMDKLNQQIIDLRNQTNAAPVAPPPPTNMRNVYYATQAVDAGTQISPAFFEKKATPVDILPDAFNDQMDVVGMYAIRKIEKGDPLTPRNVAKTLPYATQRISPGMRTVSLPIFNAEANFTGGFVVDGDKVDLLFTTFSADGSAPIKTEVAMQNVNVFFVPGSQIKTDKSDGINPIPPPGEPITVTFEVTPEQALALVYFAQVHNGKFGMILRARSDKVFTKIPPFDGPSYYGNIAKLNKLSSKSTARVEELAKEIQAQEKAQAAQGNTNETPTPTPPSAP